MALLHPDLVVSCGDVAFQYLEYVVGLAGVPLVFVPLVFVPGNHDPRLLASNQTWAPLEEHEQIRSPVGCDDIDGRVVDVAGLRVVGLGGSIRYRPGANHT